MERRCKGFAAAVLTAALATAWPVSPACATSQVLVNGDFTQGWSGWTRSGRFLPDVAWAAFVGNDARLTQTVENLSAGTLLDFVFFYDRESTANGSYLTYDLLFSTDGFATSTSLIGGAVTLNHRQPDDTVSWRALSLPDDGDVRVVFERGARAFSVDDVGLWATAPAILPLGGPAAVPELQAHAMLLAGLGVLGRLTRRRLVHRS